MAENVLVIGEIQGLGRNEAIAVINEISRIERRTFPPSEAFTFDMDLWKKKPNTRIIYGKFLAGVVAYVVYVRVKGVALLHKLCVEQNSREQGIGTQLMAYVEQRLHKEGCQSIQLWVDKDRTRARQLYTRRGFKELERVDNYYGNNRTGIKMVLDLDTS
ncbi:hypothetical protein FQN57_000899 [Myotisia sp. PD_48]|nr:hypothetical protein FQN57_000899 [Myotisia sp. PD_48]